MLDVVDEVAVNVFTLDHLLKHDKLPVRASPDFLSIDTPGSRAVDHEGGRTTIAESVPRHGHRSRNQGNVCRANPCLADILNI